MELEQTIKSRRSVRKYQDKDISDSVIQELLDLVRYAPSSMNGQPWHFIVLRNREKKNRLVHIKNTYCPVEKSQYPSDLLQHAPVVIVVCVDHARSFNREIENGVLATTILLLAAHSKGLGSVYLSAYTQDEPRLSEEIKQMLDIPEHIRPITLIPLGYPDEIPEPKALVPLKDMIRYE